MVSFKFLFRYVTRGNVKRTTAETLWQITIMKLLSRNVLRVLSMSFEKLENRNLIELLLYLVKTIIKTGSYFSSDLQIFLERFFYFCRKENLTVKKWPLLNKTYIKTNMPSINRSVWMRKTLETIGKSIVVIGILGERIEYPWRRIYS